MKIKILTAAFLAATVTAAGGLFDNGSASSCELAEVAR